MKFRLLPFLDSSRSDTNILCSFGSCGAYAVGFLLSCIAEQSDNVAKLLPAKYGDPSNNYNGAAGLTPHEITSDFENETRGLNFKLFLLAELLLETTQ